MWIIAKADGVTYLGQTETAFPDSDGFLDMTEVWELVTMRGQRVDPNTREVSLQQNSILLPLDCGTGSLEIVRVRPSAYYQPENDSAMWASVEKLLAAAQGEALHNRAAAAGITLPGRK